MHRRKRVWGAGAVLTATAGIVLSASPAQAAGDSSQAAQWQVGMQVAGMPVSLTGEGGPPAVLLGALPQGAIAVEHADGQHLLQVNASGRFADARPPALPPELADRPGNELPGPVVLAERTGGVRVTEADQGRAPVGGVKHGSGAPTHQEPTQPAPTQQVGRNVPQAVAAPAAVPLQVPATDSVFDGRYAWVPIEGIAGPDAGGLPWASGLALVVLVGGAGAVTVVARHRRSVAG